MAVRIPIRATRDGLAIGAPRSGVIVSAFMSRSERLVRDWINCRPGLFIGRGPAEVIRMALDRKKPPHDAPYDELSLEKIYQVLDRLNYTVKLYR